MSAIGFVWFGANLALWLALLAYIKLMWPNSVLGRAIGTITGSP